MSFPKLSANDRENILRNNWWGHDGRWYLFVSKEFGFEKANDMNMAIRHKELPIIGLQFHPESIMTEYGINIMKNWL